MPPSSHYQAAPNDDLVFEAELRPHRSLSRRGLTLVLASLGIVSLGVTTLFWLLGAWPIAGFNGAEILLAMALLRAHARGNRERELVLLSPAALRVLRFDAEGGRTERFLPAAWLNILLIERPGRVPALVAASHGKHIEIARVLGEPEKRSLAEALQAALYALKHPTFDNPQLR